MDDERELREPGGEDEVSIHAVDITIMSAARIAPRAVSANSRVQPLKCRLGAIAGR